MKQPSGNNLYSAKFYPSGPGWLGRVGGCSHSFNCFKEKASANWKSWGESHFEKHHKGTPARTPKGESNDSE